MVQNEILQNNLFEGEKNELEYMLESVTNIQLLIRNTREHLVFYEVTPLLGNKPKWRERAMMLSAGLELAITNFLDFSQRNRLSNPFSKTLENIGQQIIDFSENLSSSQSKGELVGLNLLADQLDEALSETS